MKWVVTAAAAAVILFGILAGVLALASGSGESGADEPSSDAGPYRGSEPPGVYPLPAFRLANLDGRLIRSSDFRGKVVALTFLDSQCTESCPIIASQIGLAVDRLSGFERRELVAVAISTEPAEDTPKSVRTFLRKQGALGKLLYVSGPEAEMRALWKQFMILSSLESGRDTLHSAPVRIYDRRSVWVATLHAGADLTPENLAHDIRVALGEAR
jgi:protein SCO1/2